MCGERRERGGLGDDLLAQGLARFLPQATYEVSPEGYGRLVHPVGSSLAAGQAAQSLPGALLFVDIESLGFIGRPLFLIGALRLPGPAEQTGNEEAAVLVQYLARDYSEEEAVLRAFLSEGAACPLWVTFNGQTFDLPFLALRASYHRLGPPRPGRHIDLLPLARRRWGARLPDCRLQTLETHICGRRRWGDIPGARIPDAYHAFVRTGEPDEIIQILRHNVEDLISLGFLWQHLEC